MTMQTVQIKMEREQVLEVLKKYQTHLHYSKPIDHEIVSILKAIKDGKIVVRAIESIRAAGLNQNRLPKLAIVRADAKRCHLEMLHNGGARISDLRWPNGNTAASRIFRFDAGTFEGGRSGEYEAIVPHIPPDIRPKRGIQNYHILFEAEWSKLVPVDPMLLRRVGKGDSWVVVGAWDLTEVERAVLADRLGARR